MDKHVIIIIDADAAPKDTLQSAFKLGAAYGARVVTVSSTNHHIESPHHISVDPHPQAVDMKIVGLINPADPTIVLTQDYGLAALALGKGACAISPSGMEYTEQNIDRLLFERALHAHERRATGRSKGPKPRTGEDAERFRITLASILERFRNG